LEFILIPAMWWGPVTHFATDKGIDHGDPAENAFWVLVKKTKKMPFFHFFCPEHPFCEGRSKGEAGGGGKL